MIQIKESNPSFESCNKCIHSDDSEETCILRQCIHAVAQLKECYVPKQRTIEPQRKKGKWITDKYGNVLCSECNWCAPQTMTGCLANRHLDYEKSDFCWHCGADMRKDGEADG